MENLQTIANKYFDRKPRRNTQLIRYVIVGRMQKNIKQWK